MTEGSTNGSSACAASRSTYGSTGGCASSAASRRRLLELFEEGLLNGTTHTCLGQESVPVGVIEPLRRRTTTSSATTAATATTWPGPATRTACSPRSWASRRASAAASAAASTCAPRASCPPACRARACPVAAGHRAGQAARRRPTALSVVYIGDGTWGEGAVYEALNMAALWQLPLLVVVSRTTARRRARPTTLNMAGDIAERVRGVRHPVAEVDSTDVGRSTRSPARRSPRVARGAGPVALVDPHLPALPAHQGRRHPARRRGRARWALRAARRPRPRLDPTRARGDRRRGRGGARRTCVDPGARSRDLRAEPSAPPCTRALETDPRVILLGEDIARSLRRRLQGHRGPVHRLPRRACAPRRSARRAIVGVAAGLALAGYRPIVEIMFGDFVALCFDQIVNHVAKYESMYNGAATCPVVVRCPTGGGRGYGPTHSQSLEKHFLGVPHLRVVAGSLVHDPAARAARRCWRSDSPVLHIEHKLLYPLHLTLPQGGRIERRRRRGAAPTDGLPTVSHPAGRARGLHVDRAGVRLSGRARAPRARAARGRGGDLRRAGGPGAALADRLGSDRATRSRVTGSLLTVEEGTERLVVGHRDGGRARLRALFGRLRRPVACWPARATVIPSAPDREAEMLVGERADRARRPGGGGMKPVTGPDDRRQQRDRHRACLARAPTGRAVRPASSWPRSRRARRCSRSRRRRRATCCTRAPRAQEVSPDRADRLRLRDSRGAATSYAAAQVRAAEAARRRPTACARRRPRRGAPRSSGSIWRRWPATG